jgi:hypothetical protein
MTANYVITVMLSRREWRVDELVGRANLRRSSGSTRCFWVGGEPTQLAGAERSVLMRPAASATDCLTVMFDATSFWMHRSTRSASAAR